MPSASSTTSSAADTVDPSAVELATKLREVEHLVDATLASAGELAAAAVRARKARNLSAVAGHAVFASFGQASASLVEARGHVVKGHRLLGELADRLGIRSEWGDEDKG